jgi:hypothetical protein
MTFIVIFILVAGVVAAVLLNKKKSVVVEEPAKVEEVIFTPKPTPVAPAVPAKLKTAVKKPTATTAAKKPVKK